MNQDDEALKTIKYAALLHDIGKIGIRDDILLKQGAFTPEEQAEINTHPVRTRKILENFYFPKALVHVPVIASQHHEKVNGKGYPEGLTGDELSLSSKILAVADVFDALTSRRDYPKYCEDKKLGYNALPLPKVIEILQEGVGTHFDPDVIEAFLRCLPQALVLYRKTHFPAEYVDKTIRSINTTTMFSRGPQR
jgi:HD-GYP domain-containing protein (c-di-GMP phosphodiesterase class II)